LVFKIIPFLQKDGKNKNSFNLSKEMERIGERERGKLFAVVGV